jgi:type I restriction-modification system DNA methylase subunit
MVSDLYYPNQYNFAVIPIEILGTAYERFLGKTIYLTARQAVKVDEKPEVRKAGGVFYTPQYIVDYIVTNTVGERIKGKTPKQAAKIKIVDPACGSGSFLLGAYQYLLDWHRDYYLQHNKPSRGLKGDPLTPQGNLSTVEKKRILLNNIYGVDIDVTAVEMTKLSLLLKCMEGETDATIENAQRLFHERVLPSIGDNIRVGNSLIDTDIYGNELDFGDERKVKPFHWETAFPEVFEQGSFDIAIGNPPYVMLQNSGTRKIFDYCLNHFTAAKYKIDTYQLFIERSVVFLIEGGLIGFITPNTYLKNIHSEPLRRLILDNTIIKNIVLHNHSVFAAASVDTCMTLLEKGKASKRNKLLVTVTNLPGKYQNVGKIQQTNFCRSPYADFDIFVTENDWKILDKIADHSDPLGQYCDAYFGIQTFDRTKYVCKTKRGKYYEPVIDGVHIEPYYLGKSTEFVNFIPSAVKSGGEESVYRQERIGIRQIGAVPIATLLPADLFALNTIYNVYLKQKSEMGLKFLLGLINSSLTKYFWNKKNSDRKKTFPKIKKEAILSIPVPKQELVAKDLYNAVIRYVDRLLSLHVEKRSVRIPTKLQRIEDKITHYENKINETVYRLYGLTDEEIKIVEGEQT